MDPTLTALAGVFFVLSMALFAYGLRERRRELAMAAGPADEPVIDLRDPAPAAAATATARDRQTV